MGMFDDAVPGGNIAKPVMIALGALLVSRMFANRDAAAPADAAPVQPDALPDTSATADGGLLGGLGGLLERLQTAGQGPAADSWVKPGPNAPIEPGALGSALGQQTIGTLAKQAGMSEQDLLAQLSKVLPGLVDTLTPNGQVPNQNDLANALRNRFL